MSFEIRTKRSQLKAVKKLLGKMSINIMIAFNLNENEAIEVIKFAHKIDEYLGIGRDA